LAGVTFQAACISKITVELTTFLPFIPMDEMEYNGRCCRILQPVMSNVAALYSTQDLHLNHIISRLSYSISLERSLSTRPVKVASKY